jgi:protoporphyrinogen oxidase
MPVTQPRWNRPDAVFVAEAIDCLRRINPAITPDDLIASHVGRLRHAQPVCQPGFLGAIPPVLTPIAGLQIADTCTRYPKDRGIAESVRVRQEVARAVAGI